MSFHKHTRYTNGHRPFYAAQVPESLVAPEWRSFFDLHLNSHNVWHVFVVLGALAHYRAALELWAAASLAHAGAG